MTIDQRLEALTRNLELLSKNMIASLTGRQS
jgi:hypothetical protein